MAQLRPDRSRTIHYRSADPIRNFKLRVGLRRVTAALLVGNGNDDSTEAPPAAYQHDERLICWQQKLFSKVMLLSTRFGFCLRYNRQPSSLHLAGGTDSLPRPCAVPHLASGSLPCSSQRAAGCSVCPSASAHCGSSLLLCHRPQDAAVATSMLYTYVDADDYHAQAVDAAVVNRDSSPTSLQHHMTQARLRRGNRAQALRKQR
jgi:hypothetical protein